MKKIIPAICIFFLSSLTVMAQDEVSGLLENGKAEKVRNSFKSTRVIMGQSTEMLAPGTLDFRILHRFGMLSEGAYEMFGLDKASIRLGFDYAISNRFTVGIGRSSSKKETDAFVKTRLLWQTTGSGSFPFALTLVDGITVNGLKWQNPEQHHYFTSRLVYFHQLIIARKFNDVFTLQLSPTYLHRNIVDLSTQKNDIGALGLGTRIKLTKRLAANIDYYYVPRQGSEQFISPLSVGFDIETGGHVFQLHFTNALGMNERAFLTDTTGKWNKGDIHFGFNISRVFTIGGNAKK
ncbi:MAG: DUF5777 family beta-barrel protein [Bacteroidia bacterium]|nr:hypothetical protein [Bacteroidia bacterium]MCZ2278424.1 DUF5777 family beta-barrel protein [Bacteroidia bacterium]